MKILSAEIDWHTEFDNEPTLTVDLDALPDHKGLRYERRCGYLFASTEDGYVSFLYDSPGDHAGFGGREFNLTMLDGSRVTLKGPWSGNERGAEAAGFLRSYGCTARVREKTASGHEHTYHYGIHLTEPVWLAAIRQFCHDADVAQVAAGKCYSEQCDAVQNRVIGMVADKEQGPLVYSIVKRGMTPAQTWASKRAAKWQRIVAEVRDEPAPYHDPERTAHAEQRKHAVYTNGLIKDYGLEAHGFAPFDLNALPPLMPARPPEPVSSCYDPEGDYEP